MEELFLFEPPQSSFNALSSTDNNTSNNTTILKTSNNCFDNTTQIVNSKYHSKEFMFDYDHIDNDFSDFSKFVAPKIDCKSSYFSDDSSFCNDEDQLDEALRIRYFGGDDDYSQCTIGTDDFLTQDNFYAAEKDHSYSNTQVLSSSTVLENYDNFFGSDDENSFSNKVTAKVPKDEILPNVVEHNSQDEFTCPFSSIISPLLPNIIPMKSRTSPRISSDIVNDYSTLPNPNVHHNSDYTNKSDSLSDSDSDWNDDSDSPILYRSKSHVNKKNNKNFSNNKSKTIDFPSAVNLTSNTNLSDLDHNHVLPFYQSAYRNESRISLTVLNANSHMSRSQYSVNKKISASSQMMISTRNATSPTFKSPPRSTRQREVKPISRLTFSFGKKKKKIKESHGLKSNDKVISSQDESDLIPVNSQIPLLTSAQNSLTDPFRLSQQDRLESSILSLYDIKNDDFRLSSVETFNLQNTQPLNLNLLAVKSDSRKNIDNISPRPTSSEDVLTVTDVTFPPTKTFQHNQLSMPSALPLFSIEEHNQTLRKSVIAGNSRNFPPSSSADGGGTSASDSNISGTLGSFSGSSSEESAMVLSTQDSLSNVMALTSIRRSDHQTLHTDMARPDFYSTPFQSTVATSLTGETCDFVLANNSNTRTAAESNDVSSALKVIARTFDEEMNARSNAPISASRSVSGEGKRKLKQFQSPPSQKDLPKNATIAYSGGSSKISNIADFSHDSDQLWVKTTIKELKEPIQQLRESGQKSTAELWKNCSEEVSTLLSQDCPQYHMRKCLKKLVELGKFSLTRGAT